ncbi:EAL domain-containing protein [Candidatus Chlorohelix sp.]|uniref:two-component system response regulator n=1 Tax=Candidatus Chlorohelix sp. TaxID=3139201 RepID=UPI0030713DF0
MNNSIKLPKKKILIIEDENDIRYIIATYLKYSNYEVLESDNGVTGLETAQVMLPDLIISDINMPNMDGFTVLEQLMENPLTSSIPFIFLTCISDRNSFRKGMNLGADDFITKPFTKAELLSAVESRLSKKENLETILKNEELGVRDNQFLSLRTELSGALERKELELYYQPQVNIKAGNLVGAEALLRWHHPYRGLIMPDQFIPVAEASGLIEPIWRWTLNAACQENREWLSKYKLSLKIAVNVSASQFNHARLNQVVQEALDRNSLPAENLELEITESIVIKNVESSLAIMRSLVALGVGLSMDDFGTGYSSLSYLKYFPFNELKIDRSFVSEITTESKNAAITASIIKLSHQLGMHTVAEGVETEEQLTLLEQLGCDIAQGYYLGKPMSSASFRKYIEDYIECKHSLSSKITDLEVLG